MCRVCNSHTVKAMNLFADGCGWKHAVIICKDCVERAADCFRSERDKVS